MFFFLLLPTLSPHIPEVFLLANVISFAAVVRSPYRASGKDFGQDALPKTGLLPRDVRRQPCRAQQVRCAAGKA
jgi:hypothetical protein